MSNGCIVVYLVGNSNQNLFSTWLAGSFHICQKGKALHRPAIPNHAAWIGLINQGLVAG